MLTTTTPTSGASLTSYLLEIDETPLLTAAEEQELARRIHEGDTAARDRMIRANLRLVVKIARSLLGHGVTLEDLIEEGNLGLIHAVERYDPAMNTRFSTYACYWIKQSMTRSIDSARALPLPSYVIQMLRQWRRQEIALEEELSRPVTADEVNVRMHLPPRKVRLIKKALQVLASRRTGSDEEELSLDEALASHDDNHESAVATNELLAKAVHLLDELDRREANVLRLRFGLDGTEPMTLEQVGTRLHLTRERVRQIEAEALAKLHERLLSSSDQEE